MITESEARTLMLREATERRQPQSTSSIGGEVVLWIDWCAEEALRIPGAEVVEDPDGLVSVWVPPDGTERRRRRR